MANSAFPTIQSEIAQVKAYLQGGRVAENSTKDDASRRAILHENSSRPATVELTYTVTGTGQHRLKTPLMFPTAFRNEPHFTFGYAAIANRTTPTWHDPIAHVGVYAWKRNKRKLFTGAYIYFRIDAYPIDVENDEVPPQLKTQLCLTFTGTGTKLSGDSTISEAQAALKGLLPGIL